MSEATGCMLSWILVVSTLINSVVLLCLFYGAIENKPVEPKNPIIECVKEMNRTLGYKAEKQVKEIFDFCNSQKKP